MKPTDDQLQQCNSVLLSVFSLRDLEQLVRTDWGLALAAITAVDGAALGQVVDQLVRYYAAQEDGLRRLLTAALRQAPANDLLRDLLDHWQGLHFDPLPLPPDHPYAERGTGNAGHREGVSLGFDLNAGREHLESTSADDSTDMSFSLDPGLIGGNVTNTSGGASVGGDAHVGRDLVGRDQYRAEHGGQMVIIQGDVYGDTALTARGLVSSKPKPLIEEIIRLDVATPAAAFVNTPFEIAVSIRQPDAPKLAVEELTEVTSDEGSIFRTAEDELVSYRVEIVAPGCDVEPTYYIIKLRPGTGSRIYFYHVVPRREGQVSIHVNAYQVGDSALAAQTRLRLAVSLPVEPRP
ncbi:MAG: effector-associated domain EAD1-containing protein [Caldilineaceae bacterium]